MSAREHYMAVSRRFFALLALLQLWIVGLDQLLGSGFTAASALNAAGALALGLLATTRRTEVHVSVTIIVALLFVASFFIPGVSQ